MNSYDTKTWAWEAQVNALKSELEVQAAENRRLRSALMVWRNAYKTGRNEPLVQAYEHSEALIATSEKKDDPNKWWDDTDTYGAS